MIKTLQKISTRGMERSAWLAHRRLHIGGSDAAAIVGMSQYATPYSVWAEKTGLVSEKPDNEAMRLGRDLEEYVAKRFTEATGKKVRRENNIIVNPDYPFAHANVDRVIIGEDALLECKTTSVLNLRHFKGTEFPEKYYCQCVHYLAVTGCQRIYLAVLVLGVEFKTYCLERDEGEIAALMDAEFDFWRHVDEGVPPPVDGSRATTTALDEVVGEGDQDAPDADLMEMEGYLREYRDMKAVKEQADKRMDEAANHIKEFMGDSWKGSTGAFTVSFKPQSRSSFDTKAFTKDHPDIDMSAYYKTTITRPFKVSYKED